MKEYIYKKVKGGLVAGGRSLYITNLMSADEEESNPSD